MRIHNSHLIKKALTLLLVSFLSFVSWNYIGILYVFCILLFFYFAELIEKEVFWLKVIQFFLFYLVINLSITFWLNKISVDRFIYIILFSSLLMTFATLPYILTNNKVLHIFIWVFLEIVYTKWDVAWPWLIYGNVMGNQWYLVKWYSIVGVYGGSLWLFFLAYFTYISVKNRSVKSIYISLIFMMLPIFSIVSYFIKYDYDNYLQVLNYAPFYKKGSYENTKNIAQYIKTSKEKFDLVLTPELFYNDINISDLENEKYKSLYRVIFNDNPNLKVIIGSDIRHMENRFNGTFLLTKDTVFFKSKKRYVPITEFTTPILRPIFGESYYKKNSIDDTELIIEKINTIPFVCYEALFSDFVAEKAYDAEYLLLSTSESFMNQSRFGKRQYLNIIRLRAIENNRFLLKCSNDGVSCFISPAGEIIQYLNKEELTNVKIYTIYEKSFYSRLINKIIGLKELF